MCSRCGCISSDTHCGGPSGREPDKAACFAASPETPPTLLSLALCWVACLGQAYTASLKPATSVATGMLLRTILPRVIAWILVAAPASDRTLASGRLPPAYASVSSTLRIGVGRSEAVGAGILVPGRRERRWQSLLAHRLDRVCLVLCLLCFHLLAHRL